MIAVIVPAHNEQRLLARCLRALTAAARNAEARGEAVEILVVLDSCTDESETIALAHGVHTLTVSARNVGFARRAGAEWMIGRGARWLACTDADSCVAALEENGAHIVWTARNSVSTSSRQRARVSGGFGDFLTTLASSVPV